MGYIQGESREQISLLPSVIDDYISQEDEVRAIDTFVNSLQVKFQYSDHTGRGNQPYDPKDMMKIFIFCYLKGISSSRKIENECESNIKLMWLVNKLSPDDKTICNFRRNNKDQLYEVLKEFTSICKKANLFSTELIAVDGSKFRASNSRNKIFTKKHIKQKIEILDNHIRDYLDDIEKNDREEMEIERLSGDKVKEIIEELQKKKNKYTTLYEELETSGEKQISITDKDCKLMHKRNGEINAVYNVQVVAESKNNMILDFEVTNSVNDQQELSNISKRGKNVLEVEEVEVIADSGYMSRGEFEECIENGITPTVSIPKTEKGDGTYSKDRFQYDVEKDVYICPANREMSYTKQKTKTKGKRKLKYRVYVEKKRCDNCEFKKECFNNKVGYRKIERWEKESIVDRMKTEESKEKLKKRQGIIEPIFGTIKRALGFEYFLMRGKEGAKAEFSLAALAYDLKRAINILGVRQLNKLITS